MNFRVNGTAPQFLDEHHYYPFGMEMEGFAGGGSPYRYNNKEITADFGVNWYFYGARWYDAAVGRWWSVDPLAEKYKRWSPYNYVADNPFVFIDPNGMDLIFAFKNKDTKNEDKSNLQRQLNEGLGGYYTASIDKKGKVSLTAVEGKEITEASDQVKGFYDVLNQSVSAEGKVKINVLNGDDNVVVGSFDDQAIDMKDLAAFEKVDNNTGLPNAVSAQSKLGHEITEQHDKQINGNNDFPSAHEKAIQAENKVSGNIRREDKRNLSNRSVEIRPTVFEVNATRVVVTVTQDGANNTTTVKQRKEKQ